MHLFTAHRTVIASGIVAAVFFALASALELDEASRGMGSAFIVAGAAVALGLGVYLRWFRRKVARRR